MSNSNKKQEKDKLKELEPSKKVDYPTTIIPDLQLEIEPEIE